jgi:hypothetical protein
MIYTVDRNESYIQFTSQISAPGGVYFGDLPGYAPGVLPPGHSPFDRGNPFCFLEPEAELLLRTGKLLNPRRGIYAKPGFRAEELACKIYRPS